VLVRLDASFGGTRHRSVIGGGALASAGIGGGGGLVTLAATMPGSSMPIALIIGAVWAALGGTGFALVARSYRANVTRAQLALEQALDRLEHGEPPRNKSLFDVLTSAINR
jgi:hypothetical protein